MLAVGTVRAIGSESGVETELPYTVVASFRNGLVIRFIDYGDRDKALEAVGLSEWRCRRRTWRSSAPR